MSMRKKDSIFQQSVPPTLPQKSTAKSRMEQSDRKGKRLKARIQLIKRRPTYSVKLQNTRGSLSYQKSPTPTCGKDTYLETRKWKSLLASLHISEGKRLKRVETLLQCPPYLEEPFAMTIDSQALVPKG